MVAAHGDRIPGVCRLDRRGDAAVSEGWLRELFVHPDARGSGLGKRLLDAAKSAMPDGFWLRTPADNNGARRFYRREELGFDGLRQENGLSFPLAIYRRAGR